MPLMFFFMFNDYSSGLNFYYFISLFFSAAIMWTLRKTTNDEKLLAILEAKYQENKNNPNKKTSGSPSGSHAETGRGNAETTYEPAKEIRHEKGNNDRCRSGPDAARQH